MKAFSLNLPEDQQYCEKCGAPFVGAPYSRMGRRRGWISTFSPELKFSKTYQVCMECIFRVEAYLERRTSGRLVIKSAKGDKQQLLLPITRESVD